MKMFTLYVKTRVHRAGQTSSNLTDLLRGFATLRRRANLLSISECSPPASRSSVVTTKSCKLQIERLLAEEFE